mmetsp:Transcript_3230/g.6937  ORF Transcript_3230/g.6937 Transcript_3230/m.6937 type:complete len:149 (+) Transcript_3230:1282-1728(+)
MCTMLRTIHSKKENTFRTSSHTTRFATTMEMSTGRVTKKADSMRWFVLSSHNLSKAAWGEIQTRRDRGNREVLTIQHWELGVFLSPSTLGVDSMGPLPCAPESSTKANSNSGKRSTTKHDDHNRAIIPLPYKFRPDKYQISDEPWVVE